MNWLTNPTANARSGQVWTRQWAFDDPLVVRRVYAPRCAFLAQLELLLHGGVGQIIDDHARHFEDGHNVVALLHHDLANLSIH